MMRFLSRQDFCLILSGLAVFLVHCISVGYYPMCWNDEVEIIETGRRALFPNEDWSVYLSACPNGGCELPSPLFHYIAAAIQELLCRLSGGFVLHRLFFLASLPACAFALYKWLLLKRDIPSNCSLFVSLLFLLDPNATICAHWYRPDLWAMTLAFVALILVSKQKYAWAGAVSAFMVFFWITSALFIPLIFLEALGSSERKWKDFLVALSGGLVATAIILIPMYSRMSEIVAQYANHSEMGVLSRGFTSAKAFDFVKIAMRSPFVWLMAIAGMVLGKNYLAYAMIFVGLSVFMLWSRVYHLRMVYLMPYLFLFVAILASRLKGLASRSIRLVSALAYIFVSVVMLEVAALPSGDNSLSNLMAQLKAAVPSGATKVYLVDNEHELYLACRKLGWKMYGSWNPASAFNERFTGELLREIDAILVADCPRCRPSEIDAAYLQSRGFTSVVPIRFSRSAAGFRKRLVDFFYTTGYPDVLVYTRVHGDLL